MGLSLFDLSGKVALITGSSRGLGFTIAEGLGRAGATLILNGRDEDKLREAASRLTSEGLTVHPCPFDVSNEAEIRHRVAAAEEQAGTIDILVNNAGIQRRGPLEQVDEASWQQVLNTNLTGLFLVSKQVAKGLIARRSGKIINICSLMCEVGRAGTGPYAAAKGGVRMLTKTMAVEWGKFNIQVNGIGPGYFLTEMTRPLAEDTSFDEWIRGRTPAGRWGDPAELIGTAVYLASNASDFVNGQIIYVDGGILAAL